MKDEGHIGGCVSPPSGDAGETSSLRSMASVPENSDRTETPRHVHDRADRPAPELPWDDDDWWAGLISDLQGAADHYHAKTQRYADGDVVDPIGVARLASRAVRLHGLRQAVPGIRALRQERDTAGRGLASALIAAKDIAAERDRLLEAARAFTGRHQSTCYSVALLFKEQGEENDGEEFQHSEPLYELARAIRRLRALVEEHDGDG